MLAEEIKEPQTIIHLINKKVKEAQPGIKRTGLTKLH